MAAYRFLDTWQVPAPIGQVYEILGEPVRYPDWWGDVFLEAEGDAGPPAVGKGARVLTRGKLPYRLRWSLECVALARPYRLESRLQGDFEGTGIWTFRETDAGTEAQLDWRPEVNKAGVRQLTPLLRPVFEWNHRWAMARGQERILELVGRR